MQDMFSTLSDKALASYCKILVEETASKLKKNDVNESSLFTNDAPEPEGLRCTCVQVKVGSWPRHFYDNP